MLAISTEYGLQALHQTTKVLRVIALQTMPTLLYLNSKHDSRLMKKFLYWIKECRLSVLKIG